MGNCCRRYDAELSKPKAQNVKNIGLTKDEIENIASAKKLELQPEGFDTLTKCLNIFP